MQSDQYREGYKAGFENSKNPMDAYKLSQKHDEYRVGYVMGVCACIHAPADYWGTLAGEQAAELRVPLSLFKDHVNSNQWSDFSRGYLGEQTKRNDDDLS